MPPRDVGLEVALARIVFPPDESGSLAVLQYDAYFDESGTHGASAVITMAAVMATPKRWRTFSRQWWAALKTYGVEGEFKSDACVRGLDQYVSWSENRRLEFRLLLGSLIDTHAVYAVVVSVLRADFNAEVVPFARQNPLWHDPYPWCARTCLEFIAKTPLRGSRRVGLIFDEGHGYQGKFFEYYPTLRDAKGWEKIFAAPASAPSHGYAPLQAADWLVYDARHFTDQYARGTSKKFPSLVPECFQKLVPDGGFFDRKTLRQFMLGLFADVYWSERPESWECWREVMAAEEAPLS